MADEAERLLLSRIEDASLNASAPMQQRWLDGWILRYCPGKARRSRSVNAVARGRLPLEFKLKLAADLYRQADLPLVARITAFTEPPELDAQLQERSWLREGDTHVLLRELTDLLPSRPIPAGCSWQRLNAAAYAEAVGLMRGSPADHRASHAQRLQTSPVPYEGYAIVRDVDGAVLACGQTAQEADLVGLYDVHTADAARGQGLASMLCERMLSQSAASGATFAYLQVDVDNAPALKVYRRLGFRDGYRYHYRLAPPA